MAESWKRIFNPRFETVVDYEHATAAAHRLAEQEGILCGISSGAILHASCIVALELGPGKRVLSILPDSEERYLSLDWFF